MLCVILFFAFDTDDGDDSEEEHDSADGNPFDDICGFRAGFQKSVEKHIKITSFYSADWSRQKRKKSRPKAEAGEKPPKRRTGAKKLF